MITEQLCKDILDDDLKQDGHLHSSSREPLLLIQIIRELRIIHKELISMTRELGHD